MLGRATEKLGGAKVKAELVRWSPVGICRIVQDHRPATRVPHIQETDIRRASGPPKHLGMAPGAYAGEGYDCVTEFSFLDYPTYTVPAEIKKQSRGFD